MIARNVSVVLAARAAVVVFTLVVVASLLAYWLLQGVHPGDAYTYLAAGQRLNAGHALYALSPGDNPVLLNPPYWEVPLLSPPLVGVIWRPLALLPADAGVYLWWVAVIACSGAAITALLARAPRAAVPATLALSIPIVVQLGVANIDGFLMIGIVAVWWLALRGHDMSAGVVAGLMSALKVTPLVFVWWLVTQGRSRGLLAAGATGLVTLVVSVVGAGLQSHVQFLQIAAHTSASGSTEWSLAGLARTIGLAPEIARFLPSLALLVGATLMALFRPRPGLAFSIAAVLMVVGSPSVSAHTPALLLTALAPLAWPAARTTVPERQVTRPLPGPSNA